jgi:hypothetical protein
MRVSVACVCEHAWVENGCLSIAKAFDTINSGKFPYTLPRLSIALRLLISMSESGEHKLNISMVDTDGKKLMNADLGFNAQPSKEPVAETSFSFALNGQNIIFPHAGDYGVNLSVNGKLESSIPIYARQIKQNPPAPLP